MYAFTPMTLYVPRRTPTCTRVLYLCTAFQTKRNWLSPTNTSYLISHPTTLTQTELLSQCKTAHDCHVFCAGIFWMGVGNAETWADSRILGYGRPGRVLCNSTRYRYWLHWDDRVIVLNTSTRRITTLMSSSHKCSIFFQTHFGRK